MLGLIYTQQPILLSDIWTLPSPVAIYIYINIYIYIIKWTVFVNVTTKSAQHAHARMIAIIVEKSKLKSFVRPWFHGCSYYTNRQTGCRSQKSFRRFTNSRRITLKTIKTHHNQSKRPVTLQNALINTTLINRCSYTNEYNAKTRFSCI